MKCKLLSLIVMMLGEVVFLEAQPVSLGYEDHSSTVPHGNKAPIRPWFIDLTDDVITMSATPCDYTLNLYDEDGEIAYSVFIPAGTTQIVLPSPLSGSFELRFETDTYYYYGYIEL